MYVNPQPLYPIRYVVYGFLDVSDEISCDPRTLCNLALFCPICGEVWARIHKGGDWIPWTALCPDHGGGSIVDWAFYDYHMSQLPTELLRYEVQIWQPSTPT